jgi:hypothetical protein
MNFVQDFCFIFVYFRIRVAAPRTLQPTWQLSSKNRAKFAAA